MQVLDKFIAQLTRFEPLNGEQVAVAVEDLTDPAVPAGLKADFLCSLAAKGETVEEITWFAAALREKSVAAGLDPDLPIGEILDVVGTGGDRLGTFNISTATALLCAAAGVRVAKHGNRASTSKCGSADVLEKLGVPISLTPREAARALRERSFAFYFAPNYHPAFRHVAEARKLCAERGQRTIFNYLGPLLNPARPTAMLVGVPRPELCEPIARVLQSLGVRRAMVVCGSVPSRSNGGAGPGAPGPVFLDELSTLGVNTIAEFYHGKGFHCSTLVPDQFPVRAGELADLLGCDREGNGEIVRRLLTGEDRGPKRDAILLNAAAALTVGNRVRTLSEGWDLAGRLIDTGEALAKLQELQGR